MQLIFRAIGEQLKVLCLILFTVYSTVVNAENTCEPEVSRLISAQGHVDAYLAQASQWSSAQQGQPYCGDDKVRTGALSRAVLSMEKGIATFLALDQLTLLNFVKNAGRVMLSIETGQVHIRSHTPSRFDVTTPFVNAGIEGTEFLVKADEHSAEISVFEGKVRVFNNQGEILITKGQTAQTLAGQAPTLKQIDLKPDDAVRWALYYPPIIDFTTLNSLSNDPQIQLAQTRYESGDVLGAIDQLSLLINRQPTVELMAAQAGLFLTLGRVDSAEYLIREAEKTQPEHATLKALRAIMALTKNDKDLAKQLAQSALQSNPQSSIPYVTLSYVEQAQFNLDLALENIEKALQLAPQSGLIYCRKAELLASLGEISSAQAAAEKALALNPRLGRSNTILGFTQLMNANIDAAKNSFRTALDLDASDPLAHLGQALADIRKGHLEPGTAQLEIAASLDPNDSLIRSYLGKAYYDQNRLTISQLQFDLAKGYDPKDPTPHFYQAISKQTSNQPTQALEDMNESIRLNDNRAVYRSRLLLDQDLAARSASLARIYNDLNFEKQAYNEASKSVLLDPTNFSAHRFLADSYAGQPRHQIARVSEVLQTQLWQPANIAIIQPQLNDASFSLPQVGGNQYATFREFNPLFARDGANFQASGLVASNQTYADDAVLNYRNGKFGVSAGQFHYQSDGYRENNDQKQDIYDVLAQYNFNADTSLQAEYRHSEGENGDISTFTVVPFPKLREQKGRDTWRLGARHFFSPTAGIIANFIYMKDMGRFQDFGFDFDSQEDVSAYFAEIQQVFAFEGFKFISGLGYYNSQQLCIDSERPLCGEPAETTPTNSNAYIYSTIKLFSNIYTNIGSSIDHISNLDTEKTTINPKVGLFWLPSPNTTLRLAAFKAQKRSFINDQTLEPTQVAGFNQFFDDADGTEAWRFGTGIDHVLTNTINIGYEWSKRQVELPAAAKYYTDGRFNEYSQRAYLNWVITDGIASNIDYQYNDLMIDDPSQLITHKIPFGLSFFHPQGLSLNINPIYVNQLYKHIEYGSINSNFIVLNFSLKYRLPNRLGILSMGAVNILNKNFSYWTPDLQDTSLFPERVLFTNIALNFE